MHDCADAALLSPNDRLREVASILAVGVLRLRDRAALPTDHAQRKPVELPAAGFEVPEETVLSVHTG